MDTSPRRLYSQINKVYTYWRLISNLGQQINETNGRTDKTDRITLTAITRWVKLFALEN